MLCKWSSNCIVGKATPFIGSALAVQIHLSVTHTARTVFYTSCLATQPHGNGVWDGARCPEQAESNQ